MMISIIMLALFIEAIVSALKPLWKEGGEPLSITEIISLCMGVLVAVALKIDLFYAITGMDFAWETPVWMDYVFYVMSGVAIGRGPSFVADLWKGLKAWQEYNDMDTDDMEPVPVRMVADQPEEDVIDLEITHWPMEQLRDFCLLNDIPCDGCVTKEDYMDAIERGAVSTEPETGREAGQPPIPARDAPAESPCATKDWCDLDENGNMIPDAPEEPESDPKD